MSLEAPDIQEGKACVSLGRAGCLTGIREGVTDETREEQSCCGTLVPESVGSGF